MRVFSLFCVELRRLALSKFFWLIAVITLCCPLMGYSDSGPTSSLAMTGKYIANPVITCATCGAMLWAVLALLESDRVYRAKTAVLTDAIFSPILMAVSKILALITLSATTTLLTALVYLPYTMVKVDYLFDPWMYFSTYLVFMMPTLWISILLTCGIYQITRRIELTAVLYAGCVYMSLSQYFYRDFFARWINPLVVSFSDGFSNAFSFRVILYSRIIWLALAGGLWLFSLVCIRRYEKGLFGSLRCGIRMYYIPASAVVLVAFGTLLWIRQPFVNHAPYEYDSQHIIRTLNQQSTSTMSTSARFKITALPSGKINGFAEYTVSKSDTNNNDLESFWLDPGYKIVSITCDGQPMSFKTLNNDVNDQRQTVFSLPVGSNQTLVIQYKGSPTLLRCFSPYSWGTIVSADYVSLSNASSIPCLTSFQQISDRNALELTLPENLTPVVEFKMLTDFVENADNTRTWKTDIYVNQYLQLEACDYSSIEFEAADMSINLVYSAKYDKNMKAYNIPQAIADVMNYCTEHQGKMSILRDGRNSQLMMIMRSSDGGNGGNAGAGYVAWSEHIFTANNLNDPFKGAGADEVFAHEIIHQWWGGLGVSCEDDGLFSEEGLTVYTTYRLMKEKYGALYAKQNYIDVWQSAVDAQNREFYNRHPEYLEKLPQQYQANLEARSFVTNRYCRMPLMILKAEQLVGGEEQMDRILSSIQDNYQWTAGPRMLTYEDFLSECNLTKEELSLE